MIPSGLPNFLFGHTDAASSPICSAPTFECYNIGDIGPEGGTIFAVPLGHPQNNGVNQTNFYYEVAKNDIAIGGTPSGGYGQTCGTPGLGGWSNSGAEWGVHNKPNIATSTDFGTGHKNTDVIDAYPLSPGNPTGGIHPWLDSHDIAATLCKQQSTQSGLEDWFLPSLDEFSEMVDASVVYNFNLGLNTHSPQDMKHVYWTSSQWRNDPANGFVIADPDLYSWGYQVPGGGLQSTPNLAYRCHALSVRAIRRFECKPDPCESNPNCNCVEYNYRERGCGALPGVACTISSDATWGVPPSGQVHWSNGLPNSSPLDNIGGNNFRFECNATDVLGNSHTLSDFQDDSQGYTITVWAKDYTFIGKWKYDNFISGSTQVGTYVGNSSSASNRYNLWFEGVTHLEGNYPFTTWSTSSGVVGESQAFFKLECAATSSFASGCSSLMWGNNTMDSYFDWPAACILINPAHPTSPVAGQHVCVPWDGVFSPLDINGNTIPVEIGSNSCFYPAGYYGQACGCDYQVGDTGPGGGIIVATPWMNINSPSDGCVGPITPALQGMTLKNPTDYYYEISPENLNDGGNDYITFGNSGVNLDNISSYTTPDVNVVFCPPLNLPPGQINSIENIGQGEQATQDIMATTSGNPTFSFPIWGFTTPIQPVSAFEVCDNYSSNGYNDWFLPTTYEMEFARNYSPPGTLVSTLPASWESNMTTNSANGPLPNAYWTCNAEISTTRALVLITDFDYTQNTGFAVSGDSFAGYTGPNGYLYRWRVSRGYPLNVRAMRKFKCNNNNSPIANNKRSKFVQKKLQTKEVGPFGVYGYYPLYGTIEGATKASPESSYHIHEFEGFEYYMPNGLEMGKTQFHGDWDPEKYFNIGAAEINKSFKPSQFEEQITQPEQQRIILPDEPTEEKPEQAYTPPTTPRSRSGGGDGGY